MAHYRFGAGLVNGLRLPVLLLLAVLSLPRAGEPVAAAPTDPGLERSVVERVNAERRRAGLGALTADAELAELTRPHSCAMARRGFFAHTTPDGETRGLPGGRRRLRHPALRAAPVMLDSVN